MSRAMIQAAVTMNQLQQKLDVIGNNMANSQTTGYKSRQAEFSSLLSQQINNMSRDGGANRLTPDGVRVGSGARLGQVKNNLEMGSIKETDRALDVALNQKKHLFQIEVTENGVTDRLYTRDGSFYLQPLDNSDNVMLVTSEGHPVIGDNGAIVLQDDFDDIMIQSDGSIQVTRGGQTGTEGRLSVVEAVYPELLEAAGENAFRLTNLAELGYTLGNVINDVDGLNIVKSGALEHSNVDLSKEMTDMLATQRSYQFNARTISMGDQMLGLINQLR